MLLTLFIHFFAFFTLSKSHIVLHKRQGSYDITRSGRYTIVNCGSHDATRLVSLLDKLWTVLQPSIGDAALAVPSPAFRTFFHSASNAPYVKQLLTNVTTGVSLYPPEQNFHQTGSPLLTCVTSKGQVVGQRGGLDYYYQCLLNPFDSFMAIGGTPYIVVCPYLFSSTVPDVPPLQTCLEVNRYFNRFWGTGQHVTHFKVWELFEGVLSYYLSATTGSSADLETEVNRCVALGAGQTARNPSNYIFYAASIYGRCREFPDSSVPRRRPLENSTQLDGAHADADGPNGTSVPLIRPRW